MYTDACYAHGIYRDLQQTVTKEDFRELKQTVAELAEAQKPTEETMHTGFHDLHNRFGDMEVSLNRELTRMNADRWITEVRGWKAEVRRQTKEGR